MKSFNIFNSFFYKMFVLIAGLSDSILITIQAVGANFLESVKLMSGKVLRVAVIHYPPSFAVAKYTNGTTSTTSYSGSSHDVMEYIAKALHISYEYVVLDLNIVKQVGMGPAQLNIVMNGDADVAIIGIIPSHSKYEQCDLSTPLMIEPFRLVVPYPKEESRLLASIRPFQPIVWLCLGVSIIVMAIAIAFLFWFYRKYVKQPIRDSSRPVSSINGIIVRNFMFLFSHLTNNGFHLRLNSFASYIMVGTWLLVTVVLANAYAGTLFSFLSVAKLQPAINSLEELAKNTHIQLVLQARTELADRILRATSGPECVIGDSLRANPSNLISTLGEAKAKLITGKYAFTFLDFLTYGLIDATYRESGKTCQLTLASNPISILAPIVYPMAKNGPYTRAVNSAIQAQWEAGLIKKYLNNRMPRIDQCKMNNKKGSARQKALSLVDMSSAFVVFGLGISLSVLVFLLELIYKGIKDHYLDTDNDVKPVLQKPTDDGSAVATAVGIQIEKVIANVEVVKERDLTKNVTQQIKEKSGVRR